MKRRLFIFLLFLIPVFNSCKENSESKQLTQSTPLAEEIADGKLPYKRLSTYAFFEGEIKDLQPNQSIIPYEPASSLFTDYALKSRFISVPEGQKVRLENGELNFPTGTVLIKNFYYSSDLNKPEVDKRIIETRLLINTEEGWEAFPYIWNEEQTDALLKVVGGEKEVKFFDLEGEEQVINYLIPNKNQCKTCHNKSEDLAPIGVKVKHLNNEKEFESGRKNQLEFWQERGILEGFSRKDNYPALVNYQDESQALSERAMAYLDINCSHCHQEEGPASTSGLFLEFDQKDPMKLGVMKTPVAAGNGAGTFDFDILPGKANKSILTYRMNSTEVGIAMPELGRTTVHKEGVKLIREWINAMNE
ncbi:SO2930 family diheme c-type cytochrome [Algoriphagus sp. SE2]|uniref:SO2930 family diheme c-type cytochrome n=1 Tax=Algoriphagus sp. SE2 TaxID=3141536 RepID=UPI0031CD95E2